MAEGNSGDRPAAPLNRMQVVNLKKSASSANLAAALGAKPAPAEPAGGQSQSGGGGQGSGSGKAK